MSGQEDGAPFTAALLSRLLAISARAVLKQLASTPATVMIQRGQKAKAWRLGDLPQPWRAMLAEKARAGGYRSITAMIDAPPPEPWRPQIDSATVALADLAQDCLDNAVKLQRALAPSLARRDDSSLTEAEFEARGMEDYRGAFGHTVTARWWRALFKRTVERDAGAEGWARLEIYLPDRLRRKAEAQPPRILIGDDDFRELHSITAGFKNPLAPTIDEEDAFWIGAVELFEAVAGEVEFVRDAKGGKAKLTKAQKKVKDRLLPELLKNFPWLVNSRTGDPFNALRMKFDRKLKDWLAKNRDPNALGDGRHKKLGIRKAPPYDPDQLALIKYSASRYHESRVVEAVRDLDKRELITDPRVKHALDTSTSKSYLPASLRAEMRDVEAWRCCHLGERFSSKMIPPGKLEYPDIPAMTGVVGDDKTCDFYCAVPDGKSWFDILRPQLLGVCDVVSTAMLEHVLIPRIFYTALEVGTLFRKLFKKWGLPKYIIREGFLWRGSKEVNSIAAVGTCRSAFSPAETEYFLHKHGVRCISSIDELANGRPALPINFKEAFCARAKAAVEGFWRLFTNKCAAIENACGRNERYDCPDRVRKNIELVKARKAHPSELGFLMFAEAQDRVDRLIQEVNDEKQEGYRLRHPITRAPLSPLEMHEIIQSRTDPPIGFNDECAIHLGSIPIEVSVKAPNIRRRQFPCAYVEVRGLIYCDEKLGARIGDKLIAWFNPLMPETCTFSDLNQLNPFAVPRLEEKNGLFLGEEGKRTLAQARSAISPVKLAFREAKTKFEPLLRKPVVAEKVIKLTKEFTKGQREAEEQLLQNARRQRKINRLATGLLIPSAVVRDGSPQTANGLKLMAEAMRAHAQKETPEDDLPTANPEP